GRPDVRPAAGRLAGVRAAEASGAGPQPGGHAQRLVLRLPVDGGGGPRARRAGRSAAGVGSRPSAGTPGERAAAGGGARGRGGRWSRPPLPAQSRSRRGAGGAAHGRAATVGAGTGIAGGSTTRTRGRGGRGCGPYRPTRGLCPLHALRTGAGAGRGVGGRRGRVGQRRRRGHWGQRRPPQRRSTSVTEPVATTTTAAGQGDPARAALSRVRLEIGKAVVGQEAVVTGVVIALLCRGHVLLEGV